MSAWRRLTQLPGQLNQRERVIALTLTVVLVAIGIWQFATWRARASAPARGGTYVEALIGQPQLLNPLVTLDSNDRAILTLLYPGLTRTNADGLTEPVLAESWEMQNGGQDWRFTLKAGLKWSDGEFLTTGDVAETVQRVVDPQQKSPYKSEWDGVTTEIVDDQTLVFHLPKANPTFLVSTSLPIVPLHVSSAELSQKLIGSGPYNYNKSTVNGSQVKSIDLVSSAQWIDGEPYISNLQFRFFDDEASAEKAYKSGEVNGLLLDQKADLPGQEHEFTVQRVRALYVNTTRPGLSDATTRQQLLNGNKISDQSFTLIYPDTLSDYQPLEDLLAKWQANGQTINAQPLASLDLLNRIDGHDYDLILVEVDLRSDFDLYPIWHSTQQDSGLNLSLLDDQQIDEWLEQAHASADATNRRQLAGQVSQRAADLGAWRQLEQVKAYWYTLANVHGIDLASSLVATENRFDHADKWFIKTRAN